MKGRPPPRYVSSLPVSLALKLASGGAYWSHSFPFLDVMPVTDKPLRLLIDGHTFDVGPQGTTTFLAGLLNALPEAAESMGYSKPEIYCACKTRYAAEQYLQIPFEHVVIKGGFLSRNALELPLISYKLAPDATLSQYVRPFWLRGHSVSVIHDVLFLDYPELFPWPYRLSRRILFQWSARKSRTVFTVSDYSKGRLMERFGLGGERLRVIPNGVMPPPHPASGPAKSQRARISLLYVSRLEQRKRQDWCIRAIDQLAERDSSVSLHLVGTGGGTYADKIREFVAQAKLRGLAVELHENIDDSELERLMSQAAIALFPSQCEGFGIPIIEASARGIPCIVANNTALSELTNCFAGPTFDSESFDDFIAKVRCTIGQLDILRAAARELAPQVRRSFAWPNIAKSFLAGLVEDLVK